MNTISRQTFDLIFHKCMKKDKLRFIDGSVENIAPRMVIRDFDIAYPDSTVRDREFSDNEQAWDYFKSIERSRVMDASGSIYLDCFEDY